MKKVLAYGVAVVVALVLLSWLTGYGYLWGGIRETWLRGWENAQIDDLPFRDHTRTLQASSAPQPWPELRSPKSLSSADEAWLEDNLTSSFLVIQHDTIIHEQYFGNHGLETLTNSFSMAKSITAMAVGLAVGDGLLREDDLVSQHLPRFQEGPSAHLTLQELLQMRSNIPFGESYKDPFGFQAKAYYRHDNRSLLEPYRCEGDPGTEFHYQGGNTMLLSEVLDVLRNGSLSDDIQRRLWEPMGAEFDAQWGVDGPASDGAVERSFAQFYATTRDYARFGKLLLDSGAWNGVQLMDKGFVSRMIAPIESLTDEVDTDYYGYQIWLGETDDNLAFSCMEGLHGQFVISIPALDVVVVRTGYHKSKEKKRGLPADVFRAIDAARSLLP